MTDPIRPIRPVQGPSRVLRIGGVSASHADPTPDSPELDKTPPSLSASPLREEPEPAKPSEAAYAAQILGQDGQKRGLRGGRETLDRARTTYLETEYSGPADRRLTRGRITKTEI